MRVHMTRLKVLGLALVYQILHLLLLFAQHLVRVVLVDLVGEVGIQVLVVFHYYSLRNHLPLLVLEHGHFLHEHTHHGLLPREYPTQRCLLVAVRLLH